jgi:hypothetical protein
VGLQNAFGPDFMNAIANSLNLLTPPVINCFKVEPFTPDLISSVIGISHHFGINSLRHSIYNNRKLLQATPDQMSVYTIILGNLTQAYPTRQPSTVFIALNESISNSSSSLYSFASYIISDQTLQAPTVICGNGQQVPFGTSCDTSAGNDDDGGLTSSQKAGIIVGSVIGGLLLILCCIALLCCTGRGARGGKATSHVVTPTSKPVTTSTVPQSNIPTHGAQPYPLHPDMIHNQIGKGALPTTTTTEANPAAVRTEESVSEVNENVQNQVYV